MTSEPTDNKAFGVPNASRLCQLRGCMSPLGPVACQQKKNCAAADFASFRQKPETDDEKIARLAAGFAGDCKALLDDDNSDLIEENGHLLFRGTPVEDWEGGLQEARQETAGKMGSGFEGQTGDIAVHEPTTPNPVVTDYADRINVEHRPLWEALAKGPTREEQEP